MLDKLKQRDKKNQPPQWYQDSQLGQFVGQQQDKAKQYFGDVLGMNQLQQQGQQWLLDSPIGQAAGSFYQGMMEPLQSASDEQRKKYETELNTIYNNAITRMGLQK